MGDVLAGNQAAWEFHSDSVLIRFERGIRTPRLWNALGERHVPFDALAGVSLTPGRRHSIVLHAVPRQGADPLMEAAAGQLKDDCDPYRLVLPVERAGDAELAVERLRSRIGPEVTEPAARFLVDAPQGPMQFKAYDAKATFDGTEVRFRWSRTGASTAKWKAGDQCFPLVELSGVEWRAPGARGGHLRLLRRADAGVLPVSAPDQDPAAVVIGMGCPVHESLPFAAAVLHAVRERGPAVPVTAVPAARRDPADIADRIRHLGDLHGAGLLTDDEFTSKKAQLLAEL
ncbi:DUF4429 domain-containing protein [Streptomyces sp. NPDC006879]|uniref:DUF4429 domain-containing protein n=1 Tax=Streptomyces sp. NPDC006879 TaxID=3364767 RepID=UPI003674D183